MRRSAALARRVEEILAQRRSAARLDAIFEAADARQLRQLDASLRVARSPEMTAWLRARTGIGALAVASLGRNGYAREEATARLARMSSTAAPSLLVLRLNDVVPSVRAAAAEGLRGLVARPSAAPCTTDLAWLRALPLIVRSAAFARAASEPMLERVRQRALRAVRATPPQRLGDLEVRLESYRAWSEMTRADDANVAEWLPALLSEKALPFRRLALDLAATEPHGPTRSTMLSSLRHDRAPRVRESSLRLARAEAAWVAEALFDRNAGVRHTAREIERRRGTLDVAQLRSAALSRLRAGTSPVAALGVLADVGDARDVETVATYVSTPGLVGREARRTLGILRA